MSSRFQFNRSEFAGSLGDLGALLPLSMGMIIVNGLSVTGTLLCIALFYIAAGLYFKIPVPVQPMKVISAYAIATGLPSIQISAAAGLTGAMLLLIGFTGAIEFIGKYIPKPIIRGVQLSTGILLMLQGLRLVIGTSPQQVQKQAVEPFLRIQEVGFIPVSILLGIAGLLLTLFLLKNKKYPGGIAIILFGLLTGLLLGKQSMLSDVHPGINLPQILPYGLPAGIDFSLALFVLVLPQLPMTIGNAVIASADLSREYFSEEAEKVSYKTTTISMGLANCLSFLFGGIPMCHGAGGLAAHYNFGARTGGSNLIIGIIFLLMALVFGDHALPLLSLIPLSVLGVLLIFAGVQLGLTILDMFARKDMFLVLIMLGITMVSNLGWSVIAGVVLNRLLNSEKFSI